MKATRVAIIGAGMGGLASAADLSRQGFEVELFERYGTPGGKVRQIPIGGEALDAGPTVFTLPQVFDRLFADAGDDFRRRVSLHPANLLARHVWSPNERLDLYADTERSAAAIAQFAGDAEAQGFLRFIERARGIYDSLEETFMFAPRPSPAELAKRVGFRRLQDLWRMRPFSTLWNATGTFFKDPRLRQLFARYATYCGSSPFACPATLMLIAHVEQAGVWYVEGGMQQLATQIAALAERWGCRIHYHAEVARICVVHGGVTGIELRSGERLPFDAVICNTDANALARGFLGEDVRSAVKETPASRRTLSAITVNALARTQGLPLAHHTVFFSRDYPSEFAALFGKRRVPQAPTIYVCAQDRRDDHPPVDSRTERLLCLINAPPTGDSHRYVHQETATWTAMIFDALARQGLNVAWDPASTVTTTPEDFECMFPTTGGALYGPASHGWRASFVRPGSRTSVRGLYLAGGSSHPGPGVPMAATSGRLAAAAIVKDLAST